MRNLFVSYRGGAYSRAGTAFVGFSKQTGRSYPPRMIPFQFSINQGLALEFGNNYMRVVSNGAFVTEAPIAITGATQGNPCTIACATNGATVATPVNTGITGSYAPGDSIILGGGTFVSPVILNVTETLLNSLAVNYSGSGYVPGDTIGLAGGTQTSAASITVATTKVGVTPSIVAGGSGGTNGTQTVTGTTGTGTRFQAIVTVSGGTITQVNSISIAGAYTVNPTNPANEPITGGGLTGAALGLSMGVGTFTITAPGVFTANPSGAGFSQGSTSGTGTGATFSNAVFAPYATTFQSVGNYSVYPSNPVSQSATSGTGVGAKFNLTFGTTEPFQNGDWVYFTGVVGMTELNANTYVVGNATGAGFQLFDVFGNAINSTAWMAYVSGGTAARIYTLTTPYGEADLEYLKFTQSADVMSIACWNQKTLIEYPPYDLTRQANNSWTIAVVNFAETTAPPATCHGSSSGGGGAYYQYAVTSINPLTGAESVASPYCDIPAAVDIATTAGANTIKWSNVPGVNQYNIYKAEPGYGSDVPVGALFGFAGSAYGVSFTDNNITADFTQVPPQHANPFARGQITGATPIAGGSGYTNSSVSFTISTSSGSGAVLQGVTESGSLVAILVLNPGQGYAKTDTITVNGGTGATASLQVGAQSGTYPGSVAYFQERRVYASSINNPDTYWMSQPGAYLNFDYRIPTINSDSITGAPWAVEVNGIQWMINMPGGLVVLTGLSAWQLTGNGGSSLNPQPITPSSQQAQPQAYNGCSPTVPPVKIDYQIIYLQAKGSIYREFSYQFYTNIYTGADLTQISSQLFTGYTIREHAWCEEPYKVLWSVRNDGVMLSMTYLKTEEVAGWARHDTNGLFQTVCSITEPPVDALYLGVQRFPGGQNCYMIERMDNRIWSTVEDVWCVDAGLSLPLTYPAATLTASSATGLGALTGATSIVGGSNYSAGTYAVIIDNNGQGTGSGAVPVLTIVGGAITNITFPVSQGAGYKFPAIQFIDPANTGSGASATLVLNNTATFTASAAVFSNGQIGSVIRMGGGNATITAFISATEVIGNITTPITALIPNSATMTSPALPQPAASGAWSIGAPVTVVSGLNHLIGATVTGLADGNVIAPQVVSAAGSITLPTAASAVVVGLGFTAQLQSVPVDAGEPTIQGQRKKISAFTARIEASRGLSGGSDQQDGSTISPNQIAVSWKNLSLLPDKGVIPYNSTTQPLYTGDTRIQASGGYATPGQVAIQQSNPLPMQILAIIPEIWAGDTPQQAFAQKNRPQNQR
ncbi:MAG TPA: hypothetical protein PLO16_12610 [Acidocella sp.]|nr:hypothetical protein [Acidocella sp.]